MSDLKRYGVTAGVLLVLACGAAVAWVQLASPAEWEVREQGMVLTEAASVGDFNLIAVFTVLGVVISLLWGGWSERRHPDAGWVIVAFVVTAATLASIITWQLGMAWGPPDPATVEGLRVGDTVPNQFKVDSVAPFVAWPMVAAFGALLSTMFRSTDEAEFEPTL